MSRALTCITLLLVLGACSRSPEFVVHDQILDWPALDSVTDIRSQLVFDGEEYLLAGELTILSIKDTLPSTRAEVLYTFHDSLWEHYTHQKWPDREIYRPAEINHDYFRNTPACYINRIFPFDRENILVLLVLNYVTQDPDTALLRSNRDQLAFLLNKRNRKMTNLPGLYDSQKEIDQVTYWCEFDDISSLKAIKMDKDYMVYSTSCYDYRDSKLTHVPGIASYSTKTGQMEFFIDPPDTATWTPGILMAENLTIYALTEQGASVLVHLDTADSENHLLRDAAFFSPNDPDVCAIRLIWNEAKADFTLQLALVDQGGTEKIFHEIAGVPLPGRTLYEADNGKLLFFYEKDAQVHQLSISKK